MGYILSVTMKQGKSIFIVTLIYLGYYFMEVNFNFVNKRSKAMNEQEEKPKMFFNKSYEEIINAFAYLAVPKINALYSIYSHEKI